MAVVSSSAPQLPGGNLCVDLTALIF